MCGFADGGSKQCSMIIGACRTRVYGLCRVRWCRGDAFFAFEVFLDRRADLTRGAAAVLDDAVRVGYLGRGTLCSFLLELA
jgi:hypothetical protein